MKKSFVRAFTFALLSIGVFSCEKDYGDKLGPLDDSLAEIPVTVKNATYFERVPIVTTSVAAGGKVEITLQIPADKGKIQQIMRVATGTTLANLQGAESLSLNYNATTKALTPIMGNGTNEITYLSTLATYTAYRTRIGATLAGSAATVAMTAATANTPAAVDERNPTTLRYWFRIKLDDGTEIIPTEVRVRLLP